MKESVESEFNIDKKRMTVIKAMNSTYNIKFMLYLFYLIIKVHNIFRKYIFYIIKYLLVWTILCLLIGNFKLNSYSMCLKQKYVIIEILIKDTIIMNSK